MSVSQKIIDETEQYVLHTYNRFPVVFDHGEGVRLYDVDGKEYLDFGAGIAVFADPYLESVLSQAASGCVKEGNPPYWSFKGVLHQFRRGGD